VTRTEFEQLRDVPDKLIAGDLSFSLKKNSRPLCILESVPVENTLGVDLLIGGHYNPELSKIVFTFHVRGVGPICRVCINGREHPGAGRTHKHDLINEDDPSGNLPHAVERPDLAKKAIHDAWVTVCRQAKIEHQGNLVLPAGGTK
jgi:hypothetical protein